MDFQVKRRRLQCLKSQRNILAGACVVLLAINVIQSLWLSFRHEQVTITPPQHFRKVSEGKETAFLLKESEIRGREPGGQPQESKE